MGMHLDQYIVDGLFRRYVDSMKLRKFYMHSDDHSWHHLLEKLDLPHDFNIFDAPDSLKARLLDEMLRPEHIGCGHIKGIMTLPERYDTPVNITQVRRVAVGVDTMCAVAVLGFRLL